jgi:mannan endo-1,4-beta-mannosidase
MKRFATFITLLAAFAAFATPMRGINLLHYDQVPANIAATGANVARINVNFGQPEATSWAHVKAVSLDLGLTPIVSNWVGTCKEDPKVLAAIVDAWVAQSSTWTQLNKLGIVNIANEWGPNTVVWRDSYLAAIKRMRAAGYTGTLMIDAGSCGQSPGTIVTYGQALLEADPLHDLLFDVHIYGAFMYPATASYMIDYTKAMAQLKATGLPIFVGEFGPLKVGPSQTKVPLEKLIADIEANGWGWAAWAMDDNDLPDVRSDDNWFSMQYDTWDRKRLGDANFTKWGAAVVAKLRELNAAPAAKSVLPALTTALPLHCKPQYSCSMQLSAASPIGSKVTFSAAVLPTGVSLTSAGVFAWYTSPLAGTYPMTLTLKDSAGNVSTVPVTLNVSW